MKLPSALNATSLCGFQRQPNWSWVPPTAVTYGLDAGQPAVGNENERLSFCCLDAPVVPSSPDAAKNESPFAIPRWKTCVEPRGLRLRRAAERLLGRPRSSCENTVPDGYASIAWSIALNRFGKPCTPSVSAGGTPSSTMCACGAIA